MKEIKFRLIVEVETDKDKIDKELAEIGVPLKKSIETVYFILDDLLETPYKLSDWSDEKGYKIIKIISKDQYTGLKDKNDKEIYEGDIVKITHYKPNYKVVFENGCFRLESRLIRTNSLFILHNYLEIEIIGNIYENPELIE